MAQVDSSTTVTVKFICRDSIYRISTTRSNATFTWFSHQVIMTCCRPDTVAFDIFYIDDEEDKITVSSESEWRAALMSVVKFTVIPLDKITSRHSIVVLEEDKARVQEYIVTRNYPKVAQANKQTMTELFTWILKHSRMCDSEFGNKCNLMASVVLTALESWDGNELKALFETTRILYNSDAIDDSKKLPTAVPPIPLVTTRSDIAMTSAAASLPPRIPHLGELQNPPTPYRTRHTRLVAPMTPSTVPTPTAHRTVTSVSVPTIGGGFGFSTNRPAAPPPPPMSVFHPSPAAPIAYSHLASSEDVFGLPHVYRPTYHKLIDMGFEKARVCHLLYKHTGDFNAIMHELIC